MDWNGVIEVNAQALRRVVTVLFGMAGLTGQFGYRAEQPSPDGAPSPAPHTLSRHLHRAVLRLLRPAEAAARRLIVVAARDLVVVLPRLRRRPSSPPSPAPLLRRLGIAVVVPAGSPAAPPGPAARPARRCQLALVDPLPRRRRRLRPSPTQGAPRVLFPGEVAPHRVPPPPGPGDRLDATRLSLRLDAVAAVLDDLPGQALRLARWRARRQRAAHAVRRLQPLRPGRPPGLPRRVGTPRLRHEMHELLAELHHFALAALAAPDTS